MFVLFFRVGDYVITINDVNVQDGKLELVRELLQEDRRNLKLVLRRAANAVEKNVNIKLQTDIHPLPGIKFAIMAIVDSNNSVASGNNYDRIQDGDRIEMVTILHFIQ